MATIAAWSRGDLLGVLSSAGGSVSYQTTVAAIRQDREQVTASLSSRQARTRSQPT